MRLTALLRLTLTMAALLLTHAPAAYAASAGPALAIGQQVTDEPLLGGRVGYTLTIRNTAANPVTERAYNLSVTDTLPAGLRFASADPPPALVAAQADGTTRVTWDNIADLDAGESLAIALVATLNSTVAAGASFSNAVEAAANAMPDNSGAWVRATHALAGRPQAVDLDAAVEQSIAGHQASGAGEMSAAPGARGGADWPFRYRLTLRNNGVGSTSGVTVTATLPAGVAYLGAPTLSPNPTGAAAAPSLTLQPDGALTLRWQIGTLTTAQSAAPVVISFDAAVPYRFRTAADTPAAAGPFAGPMGGAVIPEDVRLALDYEATGLYAGLATGDGSQSTPSDDAPAAITADYMTVRETATPGTVGIGSRVTFGLSVYVSEYYAATDALLTDVLPDGMTYVDGSASQAPASVQPNTPSPGRTTIVWALDPAATTPGATVALSFQAAVDPVYDGAPLTGQPVVSSDRLTNRVTLSGGWLDMAAPPRSGAASPDESAATVATRMPSFSTEVWRADRGAWEHAAQGFTGDTLRFRLRYASAADVDARAIVIRDFLPRGMTYVAGSAAHTAAGSFTGGAGCASAPAAPAVGAVGGLQYLEWRLCNAARGATWEATIDARLGDIPDIQPDWLVGNFGKLTGQGSGAVVYSLRDSATVDYAAPSLTLTKTASPATNLVGGSAVSYTITVKNDGRAPAYGIVVTDVLPADLRIAASGGTGAPAASSYAATSGDPAGAHGGVLTWSAVASLAAGATQTFRYSATVVNGLAAGSQMTNLASVSYNSRADGAGHRWAATANPADANTDDETVYLRGVTLTLSASPATATIGDTVTWTITGSVPAGVVAYWPAVQVNSLPQGFAYLRTLAVTGASLDADAGRHPQNPLADGQRELRWFLGTLDNTAGAVPATFSIQFQTLVTGYKPGAPATAYYTNSAVRSSASAGAYVGWYDTAAGYQGTGGAYHGLETNRTTRRSPRASATVTVPQPSLALSTTVDRAQIGAGETAVVRLQVQNQGYSTAYDVTLAEALPAGLTFASTSSSAVALPAGWAGATPIPSDTSVPGAAAARYGLDLLPSGATWTVLLVARADAGIAADLRLTTRATVPSYSSQPGTPGDADADGIADERVYAGPSATADLTTPASALRKDVSVADELVHGADLTYTLTVPAAPVNATLYNVTLADALDPRLQITGVGGGTASGNAVSAALGTIPPGQQRTVTIGARLPAASSARDGDIVPNQASYTTANAAARASNPVASTVVAPALVLTAAADRAEVRAGDVVGYLVTVANVGGGRAEALTLAPALPAGLSYVPGSAQLNGAPLADPGAALWSLPALAGGAQHTVTLSARVDAAAAGTPYPATFAAAGRDSRAQAIPAANQARVVADTDPDDRATAAVYGPLAWSTDRTFVGFEDLKKYNWSDWDYNDFLVRITIRRGTLPSGELAAVELDYEAVARGAGFLNHAFRHQVPVVGGGWYRVAVSSAAGAAVRSERAGFNGDDPTFTLFGRTRDALPQPSPGMEQTNTRPEQQGLVAGQRATLTVVLSDPASNPQDALPPLPWDPYLHVTETGQDIHLVRPGHLDNTQTVTNRYDKTAPLLGYDLPLARVFPDGWRWPREFAGIWRGYPAYAAHIQGGGVGADSWAGTAGARSEWLWGGAIPTPDLDKLAAGEAAPGSRYFAAPVAADLNGDGRAEIVVGNLLANRVEAYDADMNPLPGWPQAVGGGVRAAAAVADLDGDGRPEVLAGAADGRLYAWRADGSAAPGWPVNVGVEPGVTCRVLATPAVGDLDGDGHPEVLVPLADGRLYAWHADGAPVPGWPVSIGELHDTYDSQVINSSPRIADLDGDGHPEVVVGSTDGRVYAFAGDGSPRWSFATGDMVLSTPAVADIDPARAGLEVAAGSGDGYVYLLDAGGARIWRRVTGWTVRSSPLAADLDGDGDREVLVGGDDDRLWAWHHTGARVAGWPQVTGADIFGAPALGDVDGDGQPEVLAGSDDARVYAWRTDGTPVPGWPRAATLAVKGAPALANLDADPALEVVAADMNGSLHVWGGTTRIYAPLVRR